MSSENQSIVGESLTIPSTQVEEVDMMSVFTQEVKEGVETTLDEMVDIETPNFLGISDDGIYIYMEYLSSKKHFQNFINELFSKGYYLHEIEYETFLSLYFDNDMYQNSDKKLIKISSKIKKLQEKRVLKLYQNIQETDVGVEFLFDKFIFLDDEESIEPYSFDEIVAVLWGKGILSGLLEAEIKREIASSETKKIIIAKNIPPIHGEDARIEQVFDFIERNLSPTEDERGRLDYKTLYNSIPQIDAQVEIYKKIPIKIGKDGRDIYGNPIPQSVLKDVKLETKKGEGTKIVTQDFGGECLISEIKGYLDIKAGKVCVTKNRKPHRGNIDGKTGNIAIEPGLGDFTLIGDIQTGYDLLGNDLFITGIVNGSAHSRKGNIEIKGNVVGCGDNSEQRGYVKSTDGNVSFLTGVISKGQVLAPKGIIDMESGVKIEMARMSAKEIQGDQSIASTLIGKTVKMNQLNRNNIIIASNIDIEKIQGENNEIIIVLKGDITVLRTELATLDASILEKGSILSEKEARLEELKKIFKESKLNYENLNEFKKQTQNVIQHAVSMSERLKDRAFVQGLSEDQRNKIGRLMNTAKRYREIFLLLIEIPKCKEEKQELELQRAKIQSQIDSLESNPPTCNITHLSETTTIKTVVCDLDSIDFDIPFQNLYDIIMISSIPQVLDLSNHDHDKPYTFSF